MKSPLCATSMQRDEEEFLALRNSHNTRFVSLATSFFLGKDAESESVCHAVNNLNDGRMTHAALLRELILRSRGLDFPAVGEETALHSVLHGHVLPVEQGSHAVFDALEGHIRQSCEARSIATMHIRNKARA